MLTPEQEYILEQKRLQKLDERILPPELKLPKLSKWQFLKNKAAATIERMRIKKKYILKNIGRPLGAPTYSPLEGGMIVTEQPHPDYYSAMVRERGEVIKPLPEDTPEIIAELVSQAACDHEFRRVIVHPIKGVDRVRVLELLQNDEKYPMYEYREANIVNNDDLNSETIIYKYGGQSHFSKPV